MMNRVKSIMQKQSFKNGIWMYLLQFFNSVVPLLTLPYITRVLGKENYGIFSVALNIVVYLQVIVEYGFGMSATRKVALNDKRNINKLFTAVFTSRVFLVICCSIFFICYSFVYRNDMERCLSIAVLMICLVGHCFQMNWLFQGLQDMKFISIINIVARTISVILIFCFVKNKSDLLLYCFLYSSSPLISGVVGFIVSAIRYHVRLVKITIEDVVSELKDGFYVFTTQLSSKVFGAIGVTFLGIFAPYAEVGIFSAIQKVTNIMILAWTPITQVLYPISSKKISDNFASGKKYIYKVRLYILPIFIVLALMVAVLAKPLIALLFGAEYAEYYYWIFPLLVWLIIAINNNFLGIQILLASGYDKEYSKCFQSGVICTILLNLVLTYLFHGTGASVAPALSELFLAVLLLLQIKKIENSSLVKQSEEIKNDKKSNDSVWHKAGSD